MPSQAGRVIAPVVFVGFFRRYGNVEKAETCREGLAMRRAILKLGDKTTAGGTVLEGVDSCTHNGTPITYIGARIWCPACDSEGVIGWKGPHRTATMMGKQQALDGDECLCKCAPPPICVASPDTTRWHSFDAHELAGAELSGNPATVNAFTYDERYRLTDVDGRPLANVRYRVRSDSEILATGITDSNGCTQRIRTDESRSIRLDAAH